MNMKIRLLLTLIVLIVFGFLIVRLNAAGENPDTSHLTPDTSSLDTSTLTPDTSPPDTSPPDTSHLTPAPPTPLPPDSVPTFFLSLDENGYSRLYAYAPGVLAPLRLTDGLWNDVSPALSPDGRTLAFASDRNAYWDIYLLDLASGQVNRLTDTPAYDSSPRWSPDSLWIIFDSYLDDNLDIVIASTVNPGEIIRLTDDPASDQRPSWSPSGRQIAFISDRSGDFEVWIANLDTPGENRFQNISLSPNTHETNPLWSPDGRYLAWESSSLAEPPVIYLWDSTQPTIPARALGPGSLPTWNQFGDQIAATIREPNQDYLLTYSLDGFTIQPPVPIRRVTGMEWRSLPIASLPATFQRSASITPAPLFTVPANGQARASLLPLEDVIAPQPYLHQSVIPAFDALRQRAIHETGWDVLANLENAHTPLTAALEPGRGNSWLYTGRAFGINPLPLNAEWMHVIREDYGGQTYWRIYLRPQAQDGSMGEPLRMRPWDLNERYSLNPMAYEQGGQFAERVPPGYWVDFTRLTRAYGWQRQPAQTNWRTYFKGTLFNEFVIPGGFSWREAMLELYPPDVLITPTIVIPPTRTHTPTPTGYRYKTPTPTPTFTPTMRPTYTPLP
jgi:TolB protein